MTFYEGTPPLPPFSRGFGRNDGGLDRHCEEGLWPDEAIYLLIRSPRFFAKARDDGWGG